MVEELKQTSPRPFVFVLMPFDPAFNDIYKFGIKGAAEEARAYAERVDEQIFVEGILERIFNQINKADVIVADMTGRNPNVFYEVGYAHALGKIVLLLTQNADDIPFDLKHHPHTVYGGSIDLLRNELVRRIAWGIEESKGRQVTETPERILLTINNIDIPEATLGNEIPAVFYSIEQNIFKLRIHVRNSGKNYITAIQPIYLFTDEEALLVPIEASSISTKLRWGGNEVESNEPLESIEVNTNDDFNGLTRQYFLNEYLHQIVVGAVERLEIPLLYRHPDQANVLVRLRLRLHTGINFYDYPFLIQVDFHENLRSN